MISISLIHILVQAKQCCPANSVADRITAKNADIHIKVFQNIKLSDEAGYLSARQIFLTCGFYEIVGESGNSIFTCQFLDTALAKRIFDEISLVISKHPLLFQVTLEPCIQFWRKQLSFENDSLFSPVPGIETQKLADIIN